MTPKGQRAVSTSEDGTLKVWNLESGSVIAIFSAEAPLECCAVAPEGTRLVAGDQLGRLHFLAVENVGSDSTSPRGSG